MRFFGENPLFWKILENRGSSYQKSHIELSGRARTFNESSLKSSEITFLRDLIYIRAGNLHIVKKVIFLKKGVLGNLNVIYMPTCHTSTDNSLENSTILSTVHQSGI